MQDKSPKRKTSKQMHNKNAFNYLSMLTITHQMLNNASAYPDLQVLLNTIDNYKVYDQSIDYAAKFTELFEYIETHHEQFESGEYNDLIISIYENINPNLQDTYDLIKEQVVNTSSTRPSPEHSVGGIFKWAPQDTLSVHPTREEGLDRRFQSVYGKDFTPQSRTNMPYVLQESKDTRKRKQLHFGTQARRLDENSKISETFKLYLQAKRKQNPEYRHLYINKLGLDRKQLPKSYRPKLINWATQVLEGAREYFLTKSLHDFADTERNLYMVTLPADQGHMSANAYKKHNDKIALARAQKVVLDVLNNPSDINNPDPNAIKDFYLSPSVKAALYPDFFEKSNEILHKQMVEKGTNFLGLSNREVISTAEQQAIFFHTFAFEFTEKLLDVIDPDTWNCSCKDAIDRGKAHYAYYNLVKSFTTEGMQPWTFDQFNEALHGTATMVKGRGMNKHHKIIWNAIDVYVNNNYDSLLEDPNKCWLIEWRNLNCPTERVNDLLEDTIKKAEAIPASKQPQLSDESEDTNCYSEVLQLVKESKTESISHNRVLLTALTTSMTIARTDYEIDKEAENRHKHIIDHLPEESTMMSWLKGALTVIYGAVIFNKEIINSGRTLMNGVSTYQELCDKVSLESQSRPGTPSF